MNTQILFIPWRFNLLIFLLSLIITVLVVRMIDLAIIKHDFLQTQGDARTQRVLTTPAFRGMITDRNGYPLAISTPVFAVWMNPQEVSNDKKQVKELGDMLGRKSSEIQALIKQYKDTEREFIYLKRDVSPVVAKKIKSLKIPGVYLQQDYKRFYPEGEVTAHIVGFTNVDDKGQEGIELAKDNWLIGTPGKNLVIKDRKGRVISDLQNLQEKKSGKDLALSINRRIQNIAYRELLAGVDAHKAESGSAVVLDVKTGEILAMVNQPSFNPNKHTQKNSDAFRNRAVTDVFEPGSTMKAFSIASALDSGLYKPQSVIDTHPGWMRVGHNVVKDEHNNGPLTLTQIVQISSNVGATKVVLSLPPSQLWSMLSRVGFGKVTDIGFPGERSGELVRRDTWSPFAVATLAFGYGLSVTTLQLAQAYSIIANHGIKIPLSLYLVKDPPAGERVMNEKVADQMIHVLESVVAKGGTGHAADLADYRVAGKTGTAEIAEGGGYAGRYVSSFVGIAPASDPRFVVAVVMRNPQADERHGHHGGYMSGPVFKKIMEGTLHTYNVPPDKVKTYA